MQKGRFWLVSTVVIAAVMAITACGSGEKQESDEVRYVKTVHVRPIAEAAELNYPGKTKSQDETNVAFRVAGTIQRVLVSEGQYVKQGQLLAEMDPRDYKVQLAATQAEYEQVKAEAERVIALYNDKGTTASNYDRARYGLQQITEKLEHHKHQLEDTRIYAPFSGYIQSKLRSAGETVAAGMPVVSMFNDADVEIEVYVPASDHARQADLLSATCSFDVTPGITYPLEIVRVSKEANASQLYSARLRIKGGYDHKKITPGMSTMVYVTYRATEEENGVLLPVTSILRKGDACSVFVLDTKAGVVRQRKVEVGRIDSEGNIQVLKGLQPQEVVVCAGVRYLTDGQRVKEIAPTSKANVGGLL